MKRFMPKSRLGRALAVGLGMIILIGVSLWNLPLATQWQPRGRGAELLLQAPPTAVPWERKPDKDPGAPYMRGLKSRVERLFQQDNSDPLTGTFIQTVMEFDSPTWAWLAFRDGSPEKRYAQYGEIGQIRSDANPEADDQRYFCLRSDDGGGDRRYSWLRYGQYLVEIEIAGRISAETSSRMLEQSVTETDESVRRL
ncbi:hypothetical protein [Kitasatospora sp. NPDC097643]|uniref:hypothetical protein n=1 Tax=Kitasatospora sp. NPDC097643 TaxID=3157230 RepID=UPI0033275AAE